MKLFSSIGIIYYLFVCAIMSAVRFVVMNCSLSFSPGMTENGEIAAKQILETFAVVYACACQLVEVAFVSQVVVLASYPGLGLGMRLVVVHWPQRADYYRSLRANVKAGALPASPCDFWSWGGQGERGEGKGGCGNQLGWANLQI